MEVSSENKVLEEKIKYENDDEYRLIICKLFTKDGIFSFYQNKPTEETLEEIEDDIYFDEMLILKNMEYLFSNTKENILFQNLYDLAAARVISTDRTIGQCVLFSYDYLSAFYDCLVLFMNFPEEFTENCLVYQTLVEMIRKR